jgi:alcohol/geraniol dehydrogenase (NADP+)
MAQTIHALAASDPKAELKSFEFNPGELGHQQVEIEVESCGICHSDLSMLNNDWGITTFPFVPGHEAIGRIVAAGSEVRGLLGAAGDVVGRRVGLGWFSGSCGLCRQCMSGNHNLCALAEQTIVGRHGAFANRVRAQASAVIPLPEGIDATKAGPLFCGGVTVFNPIIQHGVKPTDRVGVLGIGGLGHMALQFLNKWGCEVYAFSSSASKRDEILAMGAHHVVSSRDAADLEKIQGRLDFILSTVNVPLDWPALLNTLAPKGHLHVVGVTPEPIPVPAFPIILGQKSIGGTPLGSPTTTATMLDFCARHGIGPITETFKMSKANEALEHLHEGKARYRIVLENDLN